MSDYQKKYYLENREKLLTRAKKRYELKKDGIKAYSREHYQNNKERHGKLSRKWQSENIERYRITHARIEANRRARKRNGLAEKYSRFDIYDKFGGLCIVCDKRIDLWLRFPSLNSFTIHHIIPLSRGGDDIIKNVAPAHFGCNLSVGAKVPIAVRPKVYING